MKCPMIIKIAYDYIYEAEKAESKAKKRQYDRPTTWLDSVIPGGLIGSGLGGIISVLAKRRFLPSAAIGGALGVGGGVLAKLVEEEDINEAQKIMKMNSKERTKYLKSKARKKELTDLAEDIKQD